jgi:tetratricopeptide (TPR) repeat protein
LTALLRELGIEADPVLVNTESGDLVANRLPAMGAFDHVIVRARIAGRSYWMDGTRLGDTRLDRLQTPPYHVGLPIAAGTKELVQLVPEPLTQPDETISLALDASAGIDAPATAKGEMRFRGSGATDMRMKYAGLSASDRDQQLRELWRKNYDFVSPSSITTTTDERTGDYVIAMTGTAKMDWFSDVGTRWYEVDRARLGWKFDTDRQGTINRDAPFAIDYPDYWESRETIKLPAGGEGFKLQGGSVDQEIGGIYAFHRKVDIAAGMLTMESSTRALAPELPASKAEQTRSELNALANGGVYVRVPDTYMATAGDIAALQGNKKALVEALLHRGAVHFDRQELAQSVADEDAVLAIDPNNATAHAIRALALAVQGDAKAGAAAERALALDNKQVLAWRAKGVIAAQQKRYADADAAFSKQLELDSRDVQALAARASVRLIQRRYAESLADADAAFAIAPVTGLRMVRAGALNGVGRKEEALAEADRAIAADPGNAIYLRARAELRRELGKTELAIQDYDALIKLSPKADDYLARALLWPASDTRRGADVEAALRLDPHSAKALAYRAEMAIEAGRFAAAESDIAALDKADKANDYAYHLRLELLQKQHRTREALQLVDSYVARHPNDAQALNERCWTKATLNVEMETALADCDASLKIKPDSPATLDSRAFARLKLGATDAAIADYDAALYGRAIARARKGDEQGARADLAEARKLAPEIDKRFADFGITLPPELRATESR